MHAARLSLRPVRAAVVRRPVRGRAALAPRPHRVTPRRAAAPPRASSSDDADVSPAILALAASSLPASLLLGWSAYTKATTGEGLQGDLLGGLEGVSYLVVAALVAASIKSKVSTGSGLPAGPGGLVGAAEGVGYLALAAGVGSIAYAALK